MLISQSPYHSILLPSQHKTDVSSKQHKSPTKEI